MSAEDNLSPQFLYHHAPVQSRGSIKQQGLRTADPFDPTIHYDESYAPKGVYLMPLHHDDYGSALDHASHGDVWRVNVEGLQHYPDPEDQRNEEPGSVGFRYVEHDIEPERLSIAKRYEKRPVLKGLVPGPSRFVRRF